MKIEELASYEVLEKREIKDLNSMGYLCRHKKSGARIALLSNDDDNKVFYVGFRTPPADSTGVAHILEHSVLCGSKEFPIKDPFLELAKGSLNTFLNAMTYPDKTIYPVASCNDKDFQNLMHVYMDAVFYPNIYKEEKIFWQEGWHYEMEDEQDELTINGVVYNEMKGAFSSPDDVLDREILNSLYPDTAYSVESGGDPDVIPELSYEAFLDFHSKFYHPSNSYIYLYGDMDMAEKLEWLDKHYLSKFQQIQVDSAIGLQNPFSSAVEIRKEYPITDDESLENNTYLSYNTSFGTNLDKEMYVAFQVLDYALCSAPGAPLKEALISQGIGRDVYSLYENGIYQPFFSIVAKNANGEEKEQFISIIEGVLKEQAEKGVNRKFIEAGINYLEFKYREADFGSYPRGLMYGLQMLDSWNYDEAQPFIHIEANETFVLLRKRMDTDYYEQLIRKCLIENNHKTIVVVEPVKGLTAKRDKELKEKLAEYKAGLSQKEIKEIVDNTESLRVYQDAPNRPEDLDKIPVLKREDMTKEARGFINEERMVDNMPLLFHDVFTNDIGYVKLLFDIGHVPQELLPYVGLLKTVLGYIDTKNYTYGDLNNEVNIKTGGFSMAVNSYVNAKDSQEYRVLFEVKGKALYHRLKEALCLMEEMLLRSKLEDTVRLKEIIGESKSRMQENLTSSGHAAAALRALSYTSKTAAVAGAISGIPAYQLLEELDRTFEEKKEELVGKLRMLVKMIFRQDTLFVDFTGTEEGLQQLEGCIGQLKERLFTDKTNTNKMEISVSRRNEGFMTSGKVQYVCRAGNFVQKGLSYTGALRVLKVIMGYEYLWSNIRVKGGAYGCMSSFARSGDSYFVSYRDPNLEKTVEVYEKAAEYVEKFEADERTITQFIIGTLSELDMPFTPSAKGARSLGAYLTHLTVEDVQKERDEILHITQEDIRKLAGYIRAFMEDDCVCVVGNAENIEKNREMFHEIKPLFH